MCSTGLQTCPCNNRLALFYSSSIKITDQPAWLTLAALRGAIIHVEDHAALFYLTVFSALQTLKCACGCVCALKCLSIPYPKAQMLIHSYLNGDTTMFSLCGAVIKATVMHVCSGVVWSKTSFGWPMDVSFRYSSVQFRLQWFSMILLDRKDRCLALLI